MNIPGAVYSCPLRSETCAISAGDEKCQHRHRSLDLHNRSPSLHLRPLRKRLWDWFRSVQPVLEARLADSGVIVRNQCPLAHRDPVVAPTRVGDYLAWILARSQVPSDEFVQAKLFGAPYFNGAIHR